MKLSLAITTYNRKELTIRSFEQLLEDSRVSEIIIVDDASETECYDWLHQRVRELNNPKVKLYQNVRNLGMSLNKRRALELCENEFCILADSDNIFTPSYVSAFLRSYEQGVDIFAPEFAEPNFYFTKYAGMRFDKDTAKGYLEEKEFRVLMNCSNFVVNRDRYINSHIYRSDIKGADSIWILYLMWKNGAVLKVCSGMRYFHDTEFSGWKDFPALNIRHAEEIGKLIKEL
jgi:glycosyltransferase involved in cell wall biosynthesis